MKFVIILSIIMLISNVTRAKGGDRFIFETKVDIKQYNYHLMKISSVNPKTITQLPILIVANEISKSAKFYMLQSNDILHNNLGLEIKIDFLLGDYGLVYVLQFDMKYCNSFLTICFKAFGEESYFFNLVNWSTDFSENEEEELLKDLK
jgi:hypothetical protein